MALDMASQFNSLVLDLCGDCGQLCRLSIGMVCQACLKMSLLLGQRRHLLLQGLDPIRDIINSHLVGRRWQAGQDGFLNLRLKLRLKLLKPLRRIRLSSTGSGIPSQGSPLDHGSGGAAPAAFWAEHSAMVAGLATGPLWRVITMSPWLIASSLAGDVQPCLPLE